jgi:hypothetical protein
MAGQAQGGRFSLKSKGRPLRHGGSLPKMRETSLKAASDNLCCVTRKR